MARGDATIETPHEHDVLSGRGNFVNYHPGNEYFRALVRNHKVAYVACPKPQKGKFSQMIVDEIKRRSPPGRFLKQDETTKLWYDIGEKKAHDKTRQALREGAPDIQKELGEDEPPSRALSASLLDQSDERLPPEHVTYSVGSASGPTLYKSNPSIPSLSQIPPNRSKSFEPCKFDLLPVYVQRQDQLPKNTFQYRESDASANSHFPHHVMMHGNGSSVGAAMNSNDLRSNSNTRRMPYPRQNSMPLLTSQQQQAVINLVIKQQAQQQLLQHQQQLVLVHQGQMMPISTTNRAGLCNGPIIQQSMPIINCANQTNFPAKVNLSSSLEHRPIDANDSFGRSNSDEHEDDDIAPLRSSPHGWQTKLRKEDLEGSISSLMVDSIFGNTEKNRSTTKLHNSGLSIMSLSVNNIGSENSEREDDYPSDLGRLFDSSLKLSQQSSSNLTVSSAKVPKSSCKRNVGAHDDSLQERGMASVLEMSLNTIGDELSEFGSSYGIMVDSQAEMSLGNLFGDSFR